MDNDYQKHPELANLVFDPLQIFPARIKDRVFRAKALNNQDGAVQGATDLRNGEVYIPTGNNYYDRTVRVHEALHAIYTKLPEGKTVLTVLDQALEDARIHTLANLSGPTREDEIAFAYQDLKRSNSEALAGSSKHIKALVALRAAAILHSHGEKIKKPIQTQLNKLCQSISWDYDVHMICALKCIQKGDMQGAEKILLPFFGTPKKQEPGKSSEKPPSQESSGEKSSGGTVIGMEEEESPKEKSESNEDDGIEPQFDVPDAVEEEETFTSVDKVKSQEDKDQEEAIEQNIDPVSRVDYGDSKSKVTKEAQEILDKNTLDYIAEKKKSLPTMYIHTLYANDMMPTAIGEENSKNVSSGYYIDAKRLAMTVGNPMAKIFVKQAYYNGGSVLIDASGSMQITPEMLERLVKIAPLATIAFYNGRNREGNMWIYAYKMHRAKDLSGVVRHYCNKYSWSGGNTVDFPALQWLLQQQGPRIFMTDGAFCGGGYAADYAAIELLNKCVSLKKLTQVKSFAEMENMLLDGGINRL